MMNKSILNKSILIIEDNNEACEQLVDILCVYFKDVASVSNGCEGLQYIEQRKPDVIISDIKMPCLNGIEMVKRVKSDTYQPIVIFTTAFSNKEYLLEALDIKVDGYLIKPIDINILMEKINNSFIELKTGDLKYKKLSQREYEVFLTLAKGMKPSEIALKMGIKAKTISTYRRRIFDKMGFTSNADLVAYSIENHLL